MDGNGKKIIGFYGTNNKNFILETFAKYFLTTTFLSKEMLAYSENKNFNTSLRLSLKYYDYGLYLEKDTRKDIFKLSLEYLKDAKKFLKKKTSDFEVKKQKLVIIDLYYLAYNQEFDRFKKKLALLNPESIIEDNKNLYYFLKYLLLKNDNSELLPELENETALLGGFDYFIEKADFILSKK